MPLPLPSAATAVGAVATRPVARSSERVHIWHLDFCLFDSIVYYCLYLLLSLPSRLHSYASHFFIIALLYHLYPPQGRRPGRRNEFRAQLFFCCNLFDEPRRTTMW